MSAGDYVDLVQAYKSTKGHAIYWQVHSITVSHGLFLRNHDELAKKLKAHAEFSGVAHLYQQGNHAEMQEEFREIIRLIHNYVAAVKSLVDHTRRIATKLLKETDFEKYQQRVDAEFKDDPQTRFLHDLRNYLLHVTHPPVQSTMRFGTDTIESVGVELSGRELLTWDGWTRQSVTYIEQCNRAVPLGKLVSDYERRVHRFYKWLIDHFYEACKSELDEFWAKHHQWAAFCRQNGIPTTDGEWA